MRKLMLLCAALCVWAQSVGAVGALYARLPNSADQGRPLWLKSYDATVTITDQMAVTHVDQTFKNESSSRLEGVFVFPLPKNAVVTELALWINGIRVVGDVMEKDTARAIYQSIVRRMMDPALLEYMGDNVFKLSVFPIEPSYSAMSERRIEITYAELLPYESGNVDYRFFMKTLNMSAKPLLRASVAVNLTSQRKVLRLTSPTHAASEVSINRTSDYAFNVVYGNENAYSEKDLVLQYQLNEADFALNHLTYASTPGNPTFFDAPGDDPYFLLWVTPPMQTTAQQIIRKNIVFVADVSSSMAGVRISHVRTALDSMVNMLNPIDYFNIVSFGTTVKSFKADVVSASAANRSAAHSYIGTLSEFGLTNMEEALKTALRSTWNDTCVNVVVFLTDGRPTWPVSTSRRAVLDTVDAYNNGDVGMYTFGIGADADDTLLSALARAHNGQFVTIETDYRIGNMLTEFMQRISHPLIKNCVLSLPGISAYDIYPPTLPNLFAGSQLTVMGRYRTSSTSMVAFGGTQGAREITLRRQLSFPATTGAQPFVPRMWASAKIDNLLAQIALYGEQTELVNGVKQLSKKYNIMTPYTSMLVLEPGQNTKTIQDKTARAASALTVTSIQACKGGFVQISCAIPKLSTPQHARLRVFDPRGRLIATLLDEMVQGGTFLARWDGADAAGNRLATGTYLAVLEVGNSRVMSQIRLTDR